MSRDFDPKNALQKASMNIMGLEGPFNELLLNHDQQVAFIREAHFAKQALEKNEYLLKVATWNPQSLKNAILNVALTGISLNPAQKLAYILPRDGHVVCDISYMGLNYIGTTEGMIKYTKPEIVYKNDRFDYKGPTIIPTHECDPFSKERGPKVGVYLVTETCNGSILVDTMTYEECLKIRNRTQIWQKSKSGPWKNDENEMIKKTIVKRQAKLWPRPDKNFSRVHEAIQVLNEHEGIDFSEERKKEVEQLEMESAKEKSIVKESILGLFGGLTQGMSINEKGSFFIKHTGLKSVKQLDSLKLDQLKELDKKLVELGG